jgi:GxxExxY protein
MTQKNANLRRVMLKDTTDENLIPKELIDIILTCFYRVYNDLGYGFLERVYQNALYFALIDKGLKCEAEKLIKVYHNERVVGDYRADLLVEDCVLLELKTSEEISPANEKQLINYLKATTIEVGYLLNFGKKPQYSRKVFSNNRK